MLKRNGSAIIKVILIIALLAGIFTITALAAGNEYRVVLRYYDPIQVTYDIKYPASSNHEDRTGPEDIPIGGVGKPGSGNYDINPYISTQIYCIDPFVTFHGNIPDLGGIQSGPGNNYGGDVVMGYVSATPWAMSGAAQKYGDAVRWITANGYRGIYNYGGDDDQESKESVARLRQMFPGISGIDREVAVMATKVAIWKTVAPSGVNVTATSLDGTPKRATFDSLVKALVDEGAKLLRPSTKPMLPGEVTGLTQFGVAIVPSASAAYDENPSRPDNYYGPLTVQVTFTDPRETIAFDNVLDKVFLAVKGPALNGVTLVDGSRNEINGGAPANIFGTGTSSSRYFTSASFSPDGTGKWKSAEFYLKIPKSRTDPDRGDQIVVEAFAGTKEVPVKEGTPIVFAFARDDVQDWNAIQAFVGAASKASNVVLYAQDNWNTGDTTLGELYVSKKVENAGTENTNDEFTFRVFYNVSEDFSTAKLVSMKEHPARGAYKVDTDNDTFTIKNGGLALIQGLPMVVGGGGAGYEYYYWVEEISNSGYGTPHFEISIPEDTYPPVDGRRIGPFQLDPDTDIAAAFVTVTNTVGPRPGEPEEPEEPDEPDEPDRPDRPTEPHEPPKEPPTRPPVPNEPETPIDPNDPPTGGLVPPTGDESNPYPAIAVLILGVLCVAGAEIFRRRRLKTDKADK